MSEATPLIAVVGSLHYDIMLRTPHLPRLGETLIGSEWWWKPGGKGANQAMAAARHGGKVEMVGAVGADDFAAKLRDSLETAGVGHQYVRTVNRGSGMSVALVEAGGDYSAVVVSGANLTINPARIEAAAEVLRRSRVLILQNEIGEAANIKAASLVKAGGGCVVLNAAPARTLASALAGLLDVLIVNSIEAEMLGAGKVGDLPSARAAAQHLQQLAKTAIVTAGGHGVAMLTEGSAHVLPAHPVAKAETHGAGDVFAGALAARLADGEALLLALAYANAAAALHVSAAEPDRSAIGRSEVRAFMSGATSSATPVT